MRDDKCAEVTIRIQGTFSPEDTATLMAEYADGDADLLYELAGKIRTCDYYSYQAPRVELEVRWI